MKRLLPLLLLAAGLTAGYSQVTNGTTTVPEFMGSVWNTLIGQGLTNLDVAIAGTYTPSTKYWGEEVVLTRNIPIGNGVAAGISVGYDHFGRTSYALEGGVMISAALRPFATFGGWATNVVTTPFGFTYLGTPFAGQASALETVAGLGYSVHLFRWAGADWGILGLYGTRQGIQGGGTFYGGGVSALWRF